jgi:hypothetical protein
MVALVQLRPTPSWWLILSLALLGAALGGGAIVYMGMHRPTVFKEREDAVRKSLYNTNSRRDFLWRCLFPLTFSAAAFTTYWAWFPTLGDNPQYWALAGAGFHLVCGAVCVGLLYRWKLKGGLRDYLTYYLRDDLQEKGPGEPEKLGKCYAVGTIGYSAVDQGAKDGILIYLKASFYGKESLDVFHYAQANPAFPHEPTSDLWFNEPQFESYRRLGLYVVKEAFREIYGEH